MKSVIGIGFGDEGKGLVTNYLDGDLVVRFSGGQQAAHNVVIGDNSHIFSNFGSGTMKGIPTYWSRFCTVDPIGMMNELDGLKKIGINPVLYIDGDSPITTPYDKFHNVNNIDDINHGTCGVGVGSTIDREEHFYHLTFSDIFKSWVLDTKLENIQKFYDVDIPDDVMEEFIISCHEMVISENFILTYGIPTKYDVSDNIIFEGSQGLLLDQHYGFFPHVTRSNTGTKNIMEILKDRKNYTNEIYLVTRAYQTRHGNGPMTNVSIDFNINNVNETNINNERQGKFRKSVLDLSLLEYGINKDKYIRESKNKNLVITCLDHIDEYLLTYNDRMVYFDKEYDFIERISSVLGVDNVFISKSNKSENIRKWK